ncbi:MAG: Purine-binding chemotaxis protein [Thermotoga sp. 47_83]|jgi:purine-binding chemotaxis protein CheW|uniref:Chemotaxis protein CheW n=2 Tax=Thermotogaceae TaxID=188709 RepID=A0A117L3C3_9THEM|nr:MAG: Purine-binding chemotaxis protein [Thermotoga petrophila]KUK34129.1 MAG: Purine-binding chemotaxis protein [Thermotoga sp. 47_83]MBZ4661432.1 CheW protein [Thermotoga sp.]MDK2893394.1 purine-binding chemotaxis protein CheW [Thermotoga sp.]MDK2897824.1 purine-binding chemotaxis protein CheW [Thermotoga sp.]
MKMELKVVTFKLGNQVFGVDIMKVESIVEVEKIVPVPETAEYIEGVMNLRGKIIPVVNLRKKFKMSDMEDKKKAKIIVSMVKDTLVGFLVDDVSEVLTLTESDIEQPPQSLSGKGKKYILGLAKVRDDIVIILNIEEVLTSEELVEISNINV